MNFAAAKFINVTNIGNLMLYWSIFSIIALVYTLPFESDHPSAEC